MFVIKSRIQRNILFESFFTKKYFRRDNGFKKVLLYFCYFFCLNDFLKVCNFKLYKLTLSNRVPVDSSFKAYSSYRILRIMH